MTRAPLSQLTDWRLVDEKQDLRGLPLCDQEGRKLGAIREMIVDTDSRHVVAVVLEDGSQYPANRIERTDSAAKLTGPVEPTRAGGEVGREAGREVTEGAVRVPVIEEEVDVGKRTVQAGEVHVHKEVEEEEKTFTVPTKHETLHVERRKVDRPAEGQIGERIGEEEDIRLPLREEVVEIHKRPVVREEVVISKDVKEEQERVSATVRREEVNIHCDEWEKVEPQYKQYWQQRHGGRGGRWEEVEPAYRYGYEMAFEPAYRDRQFNEVEPQLRSGFEAWAKDHGYRVDGLNWDRLRDYVREGWERERTAAGKRR